MSYKLMTPLLSSLGKAALLLTAFFVSTPGRGAEGETGSTLNRRVYNRNIDPQQIWVNTGLEVLRGQFLSVQASGRVSTWPESEGAASGPEGQVNACNVQCTFPGGSFGQLIGKIGESGHIFAIGPDYTTSVPGDGMLFLGVNDCCDWSDNTGGFQVAIKIESTPEFPCENRGVQTEYDSRNPNYHSYGTNSEIQTLLCTRITPTCNAEIAFTVLLEEARFNAPTDDRSPVVNCKETRVDIGPFSDNYILMTVQAPSKTVINYTLKDRHRLHAGMVTREIVERGGKVYIRTSGQGIGRWPSINEFFAPEVWRDVDNIFLFRLQFPERYESSRPRNKVPGE